MKATTMDETILYQENVIRIARGKWLKRWNHPVTVWAMRLVTWGTWGAGMIILFAGLHRPSFGIDLIATAALIAGPRMAWRELRHKSRKSQD